MVFRLSLALDNWLRRRWFDYPPGDWPLVISDAAMALRGGYRISFRQGPALYTRLNLAWAS